MGFLSALIQKLKSTPEQEMDSSPEQGVDEIQDVPDFDSLRSALENKDQDYDLRLEAAEELGNIKTQASVDCLIKVLEHEGWLGFSFRTVRHVCIRSLGKLGDPKAIDPIGQFIDDRDLKKEALEALGNFKEPKAQNLIIAELNGEDMKTAIKALSNSSGETVLTALVGTLENYSDHFIDITIDLLEAINRIAAHSIKKSYYLSSTGRLINYFFENVNSDPIRDYIACDFVIRSDESGFENLFGDYTSFVLDTATLYSKSLKSSGRDYEMYSYNAEQSLKAIRTLCKINSQISTNLLHKVSEKQDISVVIQRSGGFETKKTFSLEEHRSLADEELLRRGIPAYDASAYLKCNNWIISG